MRKNILSCTFIVFLSLAGCTTAQVTTFIGDVQADAAIACSFIPTVATVLAFFNASLSATIQSVTAAICATVPPPATGAYLALPRYKVGGPPGQTGYAGNIPVIGWRTR